MGPVSHLRIDRSRHLHGRPNHTQRDQAISRRELVRDLAEVARLCSGRVEGGALLRPDDVLDGRDKPYVEGLAR